MGEILHLVCPGCDSINRIPQERLSEHPRCGHCKAPVLPDHPVEVTAVQFRKHLEKDALPLVVDFWAAWCGPCQAMAPEYAAAAQTLTSEARLFKVDTDAQSDLAGSFGIRSIPTMILFRAGHEIARHSGAMGRSDIVRWVRSHSHS